MRFLLIILALFLGLIDTDAQSRPEIFPEDIESSTLNVKCLCQPGVDNKSRSRGLDISYQLLGNAIFEPKDQALQEPFSEQESLQGLIFKLRFPIINRERFRLIVGYSYRPERYQIVNFGTDFTDIFQNLDQRWLKSNSFSLTLSKPLGENYYTGLRLRLMSNGDYGQWLNFGERYTIYNAVGLFGIKKRSDLEWGVGINFSSSFRRTIALPFVFYNQTFSEKWGVEMILPSQLYLRYNLKPTSIILTGFEYNSRSYSVDINGTQGFNGIYNMNHSELRAIASMEQRLVPWLWLNAKVGFQLNFSTDFDAVDALNTSFNVEPTNSPFFQIGLFISPPNSYFNE